MDLPDADEDKKPADEQDEQEEKEAEKPDEVKEKPAEEKDTESDVAVGLGAAAEE